MLQLSILLYLLLVTLVLLRLWQRSQWDVFNPLALFVAYLFVQVGLSNAAYAFLGIDGELSLPLPAYADRYTEATWLGILSTVCFFVGTVLAGKRVLHLRPVKHPDPTQGQLLLFTVVILAAGYASFYLLIRVNGGLADFFINREAWRTAGLVSQGIYIFPATTLPNLMCLLLLAHTYIHRQSWRQKALALTLLGLSIVPAVFLGFRGLLLLPLFEAVVLISYCSSGISFLKGVCLIIVFAVVFTFYGFYRELSSFETSELATVAPDPSDNVSLMFAIILRSRGADVVATVIDRLSRVTEYEFGWRALLEWITIWVPKSIWENKPIPSGMRFTTFFFGDKLSATRTDFNGYYGGISPTFIGEAYWNFGVFGVAILSTVWGYVGQVIYQSSTVYRRRLIFMVFYVLFASAFVMNAEAIQDYANSLLMSGAILFLLSRLVALPRLFSNAAEPHYTK